LKKYSNLLILILIFSLQSKTLNTATAINFHSLQEQPFYAKIEVDEENERINIIGKFINNSESTFFIKYEMNTKKSGSSGSSQSKQSGEFLSLPNSELILSKIGLNIEDESQYDILLKVFKDDKLISSDSLNYKFVIY
jgi:hypothetical protein